MTATQTPIVCAVQRSSGAPRITDGCTAHRVGVVYPHHRYQVTLYLRVFACAEDLLAWVAALGESVILRHDISTPYSVDDGVLLPTWEVEIYDDYRE